MAGGLLTSDNSYLGNSEFVNPFRKDWIVPKIRFRYFAVATVSLPLGGLVFGVLWAIFTDFEGSTRTHCGAFNYLPSLSAAIGFSSVNDAVWKMCIGIHAIPRLIVTGMYNRYLSTVIHKSYRNCASIACFFNAVENIGLLGLTFMTSKANYEIHKMSFVIFVMSFEIYIFIMVPLLSRCRCVKGNKHERKSLVQKKNLLIINVISLIIVCYTFHRHNNYCEHGVYTIFALFEYIFVLANIGFHMTAYWDFYDRVVSLAPNSQIPYHHSYNTNYDYYRQLK